MTDANRVLFLGSESARFFALSGYLTFRGFQVDRAEGPEDARALLEHLQYRAVVANFAGTKPDALHLGCLVEQAKGMQQLPRTIALLDGALDDVQSRESLGVDVVLGAAQPIAQLARALCVSIAA